ncbi:MAG: chemotaxis protein CheB [Luteibacter sp.]
MTTDTATPPSPPVELVVVGASAGGVQALQTLVHALPADFPVAVLVVLHVPRDRPNSVPALLALHSAVPVREAEDKQPIEPGTVTFAPSDYHLLVEDRVSVALSIDPPVLFSRPAIDVLFESAAAVFGDGVLAILLTGASADGSEGVAAVRGAGGSAWIQCPSEAVASTMPASAIARAGADAILSLDDLCTRLAGLPR